MFSTYVVNRRRWLLLPLVLAALLLSVAAVTAQGPQPQSTQSALGPGFTYQGQLKKHGAPLSGTADLLFQMFDDQSGGRRLLHRLNQRIIVGPGENRVPEREVDDLNVETPPIRDDVLDRSDDVARNALSVGVEHLEADETDLRRDALKREPGEDAVAADETRDMGAVAVIVERHRRNAAAGEIVKRADAILEVGARVDP